MNLNDSQVIQSKSKINYSYATIKITQSRLDKGLISIPISLAEWFPPHNTNIKIYLDDSSNLQIKNYSSYSSSTHECRIGGMAEWYKKNKIKSGDEIVIQIIDRDQLIYRIISEKIFIQKTKDIQNNFDNAENEDEASEKIIILSKWTESDNKIVILNEFNRLINTISINERRYVKKHTMKAKEVAPYNLKVLLGEIYKGHCQVCDFWFLKKDLKPYFEIHHIKPIEGNNPKNLILVCANCHRQFEYADVSHEFDYDNWLIRVTFNKKILSINQIMLKEKLKDSYKMLYI